MTYYSNSTQDTIDIACTLASTLVGGSTILLSGTLGAGKTHFTKGLAKGLGIEELITSPTFTIFNTYSGGRLVLNHFDFYRIEQEEEVVMLGLDEYFTVQGAVSVIEWHSNVARLMPKQCIEVSISITGNNTRVIEVNI